MYRKKVLEALSVAHDLRVPNISDVNLLFKKSKISIILSAARGK